MHQFSRPDKATLKQQKLQLENFGFSVFSHIPTRKKKLEGGLEGRAQRLPPRRIADDHDSGLCFEPVLVVVVAVAVDGGAGAGGGGVGAVRGGKLKE